jgi:hypothetical protein
MEIATFKDFISALREGPYTSIGSYPKFFITSDGETLSFRAAKENAGRIARTIRDEDVYSGWMVVAVDVNWEDPNLYCCHLPHTRIESAYAEDEVKEDKP